VRSIRPFFFRVPNGKDLGARAFGKIMNFLHDFAGIARALLPSWLQALLVFLAIVSLGLCLQRFVTRFLARRPNDWHPFLKHAWQRTRRLVRFMLAIFAAGMALHLVLLSSRQQDLTERIFLALFIVQMGWLAIVIANIAMDRYAYGLNIGSADDLMARKAETQLRILRRAVNVLLGLLTAGFALMTFDSVRQFGISLFASAGIAGIVAGVAARPLFENLIAGLQLAFTQPLRLGDAVVINNEWGVVEEIGSVYIVVRLWDWRRQVVPLSYLFQTPFTNWTRSTSSIIGAVMIYADYTLDVDKVRATATEIVRASRLWDGQVVNVQVSDAREQVIEIRILASASDSGRAWDLRCEVREKVIAFIRDELPGGLPRVRREDFRIVEEPVRPPAH
jgi:small-conductance mechanosensitive channel